MLRIRNDTNIEISVELQSPEKYISQVKIESEKPNYIIKSNDNLAVASSDGTTVLTVCNTNNKILWKGIIPSSTIKPLKIYFNGNKNVLVSYNDRIIPNIMKKDELQNFFGNNIMLIILAIILVFFLVYPRKKKNH